ncbi:DUF11 domain-containing protein [Calothrix sp. 336/3]|uniref:DUF11 domain-containing protein n=1 Tax=Calothrix sp. 336/3 TaxID=1337936 RepID=UPI0004E4706A|nr:DUF11 domain-containing protein [Calothrix sp. 336/3]AKG20364.1 conserved repeat protein [Calothrix sp. 336/3]
MKGVWIIGCVTVIASVGGVVPSVASVWQQDVGMSNKTQVKQQVQLRLDAAKQVITKDAQGKKQVTWQGLQGQTTVYPGDVLKYTLNAENLSDKSVKKLTLNQPIPKGMVYKLKSAKIEQKQADITYSIDGGRSFTANPIVQVNLGNGKVANKPAPATAYTHIRMSLNTPIPAKTTVRGSYEVWVK